MKQPLTKLLILLTFLLIGANIANASLENLMHYWVFTRTNSSDLVGTSNMVNNSGSDYSSSKFLAENAIFQNANTERYVNATTDNNQTMSITMWLNKTDFSGTVGAHLMELGSPTTGKDSVYIREVNHNLIQFCVENGIGYACVNTTFYNSSTGSSGYNFYAFRTNATTLELYMNGTRIGNTSVTTRYATGIVAAPMCFGSSDNSCAGSYKPYTVFNEVAYFDRWITTDEMEMIRNNNDGYVYRAGGWVNNSGGGGGSEPSNVTVYLVSPQDTIFNSSVMNFTFEVGWSYTNLSNCSVWTNETSWSIKFTNTSLISNLTHYTVGYSPSTDGHYKWNVGCVNSSGDTIFAAANYTFIMKNSDYTDPTYVWAMERGDVLIDSLNTTNWTTVTAMANGTGKYKQAIYLNGSGVGANVGYYNIVLPDTDYWSMSFWYNMSKWDGDSVGILSGNGGTNGSGWNFVNKDVGLYNTHGHRILWHVFDGSRGDTGQTGYANYISNIWQNESLDTWHHIVLTFNRKTHEYAFYLDGNKSSGVDNNSTYCNSTDCFSFADGMLIGYWGAQRWEGTLDELYFYKDMILNDSDAVALYNSTYPYYPFGGDSNAPQWSNLANNGTNALYSHSVQFNSTWSDDIQLSSIIAATNMSGGWSNETAFAISGLAYTYQYNLTNNRTNGSYVCVRFYANDTANNFNNSDDTCFTVKNTPPVLGQPTLNSTTPSIYNTLNCNNGSFNDADGHIEVTASRQWAWYVNGTLTAITSQTFYVFGNASVGATINCSEMATDGENSSNWANSSNMATVVVNLPVISTQNTFTNATAGHSFLVHANATDADGAADITMTNISVSSGTCVNIANSSNGNVFGSIWNCTGIALQTSWIVIGFMDTSGTLVQTTNSSNEFPNQAPTIPSLSLDATVYVLANLTATAGNSTDADGDAITYYYEFYNLNDAAYIKNYSTSNLYLVAVSDAHDTLRVRSFATDTYSNSTANESLIIVSNSLPLVNLSAITPSTIPALNTSTLYGQCNITDADNDAITFYYNWYMNGTINTTGNLPRYYLYDTGWDNYTYPDGYWTDPANVVDGNWNTFGTYNTSLGIGGTYMNISYNKPNLTFGAIWQIKSIDGIMNFTLPDACFNAFTNTVNLSIISRAAVGAYSTEWYCLNSSSQHLIYNSSVGGLGTELNAYEQAVYWSMPEYINGTQGVLNNIANKTNLTTGDVYFFECWGFDGYANSTASNSSNVTVAGMGYTANANLQTIETQTENFNLSVYDSSGNLTTAVLVYNGTIYTPTNMSGLNYTNFTVNVPIANIHTQANPTVMAYYYWAFQIGSAPFNTTNMSQQINKLIISVCNTTYTTLSREFVILDELLGTSVNATASIYFRFNVTSSSTFNYTYIGTNTTHNFCIYPAWAEINTSLTSLFSATGYPQRAYAASNLLYNNVSSNTTIYLLNSTSGIYSRFKTINQATAVLVGTKAVMQNLATLATIEVEYTDDAGLATFWSNPDTWYRFTFTKAGYDIVVADLRPTTSDIYTIVMTATGSTNASGITETSYGNNYFFTPSTGPLGNGTLYNFTFTLNSSYWNISNCTLQLLNASGSLLVANSSSFTATFCNITIQYNTSNMTAITAYAIVGENSTYTATYFQTYSIFSFRVGEHSLFQMLQNLRNFSGAGATSLTFMIIAFLITLGIVGGLSYVGFAYDIEVSIGAFILITAAFSYMGFYDVNNANIQNIAIMGRNIGSFLNDWIVCILTSLLGVGFVLWRRQ